MKRSLRSVTSLVMGGFVGACAASGTGADSHSSHTVATTPPVAVTTPSPSASPAVTQAPASAAPAAPVAAPQTAAPSAPSPDAMAGAMPVDSGGDACAQRRVSYSKPCYDDPDPCGLKSGWPGDEYCMLAPAPGEGVQIHFGPKNYADPSEIDRWVTMPGVETNGSVLANIPLEEEHYWYRIKVQMRPGSHHWIGSQVSGKPREGSYADTECGGAPTVASLGGGQNLIYDNPPLGIPAPENEGMGSTVEPNASACINLHAYNFEDKPHLKEIWINLYYIDQSKVTQRGAGIGMIGGLGLRLAPGQSYAETYQGTFRGDGRIIQLFGHRHAWTPRFSAWLNDELIYDSWDWIESVTYNYDSITDNPPIDTEHKTDGAVSGPVEFKAGDALKFTCFIENKSDITLSFKNEARGGEMCNLWGRTVGAGLSGSFQ